jgi:hypothetical protein
LYVIEVVADTMKKSVLYKIAGVVIVLFWLCLLAGMVGKAKVSSLRTDLSTHNEKSTLEKGSEEWMEIFYKDRKVGYTVSKVTKLKEAFEINEEIFLALNLMGSVQEILSSTRAQVDKEFLLERFDFSLSSGFAQFVISGEIKGNDLYLRIGEKGKEKAQRVRLPSKPMISAGLTPFFRSRLLKVGDTFTVPIFDPVTMTTNSTVIEVMARERIEVNDTTHQAFRLKMHLLGKPLIFWVDEKGVSLKEEGFMGFTLVRSTRAMAQAGLERSRKTDFYDLSAIEVAETLEKPRLLSLLRVRLNQIPPSLPLDGLRQSLDGLILSVQKERAPFTASYSIPYRGNDNTLLAYLKPEMLIQSEDPEIVRLAKRIVEGTADPFVAAHILQDWVFENLEKMPVVSVPDAKEILAHKKGDCNEHAALLTALLRAAGIPARIVVGLVYKEGKFYYHAWNEAYINRWISMDATLRQMPVDATHIKLVEGGIENQIHLVGLIGNLTLTIVESR